MNRFVTAITERQAQIQAALKGQGKRFRFPSPRNYAFPLRKDLLGYADSRSGLLSANESTMAATFVISTNVQDRDGDIVVPDGFQLENYKRNPCVFFNHQEWPVPIGLAESPDGQSGIIVKEDRVIGTCYFDQEDADAEFIFDKVSRGLLRTTSIGFIPLAGERLSEVSRPGRGHEGKDIQFPGWRFDKIELLEFSIVAVPSNPEALIVGRGQKISERLRKSLSNHYLPKFPYRIGFTAMKTLKKSSRSRKQAEVVPPVPPVPETDVASDVQAVMVPKTVAPTAEAAAQWVEAHDYKADQMTETEADYIFTQFPADDCRPDSSRKEELADGVMAVVCETQVEPENAPEEIVAAAKSNCGKGACGCKTSRRVKQEETAPVEEAEPETTPEADAVPAGADFLKTLIGKYEECLAFVESGVKRIEQPDVVAVAESVVEQLTETIEETRETAKDLYPDVDFGGASEESPTEEMPEKRHKTGRKISSKRLNVLREVTDFMEEHSQESNLTRSQKGAVRHHAGLLVGVVKEVEQPAPPSEEEDIDTKAVLLRLGSLDQRIEENDRQLKQALGK